MRCQVKPTFLRILQSLSEPRKSQVKEARRPYWEIRSTLADRIFFAWTGDLIEWLYIGSHDDIQRLLKRSRY